MKIHKCFMCNYLLKIIKRKRKKKKTKLSLTNCLQNGDDKKVLHKKSNSNVINSDEKFFIDTALTENVKQCLGKVQFSKDFGASDDTMAIENNEDAYHETSCHSNCDISIDFNCNTICYQNKECNSSGIIRPQVEEDVNHCIYRNPNLGNYLIDNENKCKEVEAEYSCMLLRLHEQNTKSASSYRTLIRRKNINSNYSLDRYYLTFIAHYRIERIKKDFVRVICFVHSYMSVKKYKRAINLICHIRNLNAGGIEKGVMRYNHGSGCLFSPDGAKEEYKNDYFLLEKTSRLTLMWRELYILFWKEINKRNRGTCVYNNPILEIRKKRSRYLYNKLVKHSVRIMHMLEVKKIKKNRFNNHSNMICMDHSEITKIMKRKILRNKYFKNIIWICKKYIKLVQNIHFYNMNKLRKPVMRIIKAKKSYHSRTQITSSGRITERMSHKSATITIDHINNTVVNLKKGTTFLKNRFTRHPDQYKTDQHSLKKKCEGSHLYEKLKVHPSSNSSIKGERGRNYMILSNEKMKEGPLLSSINSKRMNSSRNQDGNNMQQFFLNAPNGSNLREQTERQKKEKIHCITGMDNYLYKKRLSSGKRGIKYMNEIVICNGRILLKKLNIRKNDLFWRVKKKRNQKECKGKIIKKFNIRRNKEHCERIRKKIQEYIESNVKKNQVEHFDGMQNVKRNIEPDIIVNAQNTNVECTNNDKTLETNFMHLEGRKNKKGNHKMHDSVENSLYLKCDDSGLNEGNYEFLDDSKNKKMDNYFDKEKYADETFDKTGLNKYDVNLCKHNREHKFVECLQSCDYIKNNFKMVKLLKDNCSNFVYKCFDIYNRRDVAIKCVNKEKQLSIMSYNTYVNIYKIVQKINNDNVVKIYNVLESMSHFFIVMELCEGTDLVEYVSKEEISFEKAKDIISQLLRGINALHANSIIHRDIKLDNLMFKDKKFEKLVIIDFDMSVYMNGDHCAPYLEDNCLYARDIRLTVDENDFDINEAKVNIAKVDMTKVDMEKVDMAKMDVAQVDMTKSDVGKGDLVNPCFDQNNVHVHYMQVNKSILNQSYNCEYDINDYDVKKSAFVLYRSQFPTNNFDSNNTHVNKIKGNNEERKHCVIHTPYSDSYINIHKNNKKTTSLNFSYINKIENGFLYACTGNTEKTFINEGEKVIYNDLIIGTKEYISPYCLKGIYSIKTDIYSIGVTIFLILFKNFPYLFEEKGINKWQNEVINKNKEIVIPFSFLFHNITCSYFIRLMDVHLMNNNIYFCKNSSLLDNNLKEIEKIKNIKIDFNQVKINAKNIYLIDILKRSLSLDLEDQYSSVSEILENKIFT
ncbi:calcium-dependent protein kinase 3 [Plasmodium gonderi]|uniref:Calcium-dependent protein kinase 3 n=1 Tax=Plasmodium gonderi TaxID=77519 RepID=A0A1Y1JFL9_PLAGO|nr:calcium-dependent protein kinase 3 [Plasmodium gonderi]GAW78884.1 calcium-dependent protein kinase 3 [Plasmodium gonderi]